MLDPSLPTSTTDSSDVSREKSGGPAENGDGNLSRSIAFSRVPGSWSLEVTENTGESERRCDDGSESLGEPNGLPKTSSESKGGWAPKPADRTGESGEISMGDNGQAPTIAGSFPWFVLLVTLWLLSPLL